MWVCEVAEHTTESHPPPIHCMIRMCPGSIDLDVMLRMRTLQRVSSVPVLVPSPTAPGSRLNFYSSITHNLLGGG